MKQILMLATGGTISCRQTPQGLAPALTGEELISFVPTLENLCHISIQNLFSIDSTDMTTAHRIQLAKAIQQQYAMYDGFVIAHGTDTLAYTAALLFYMLRDLNKPVILTGSQYPIGMPASDAEQNLLDAFRVACSSCTGVVVVVHQQIIQGNCVEKIDCVSPQAFTSVNMPPLGTISHDGQVQLEQVQTTSQSPQFQIQISSPCPVLKLVPDLEPSFLGTFSRYPKLIIESYGAGGIPSALADTLSALIQKGTQIYITTQCLSGTVDLSKYAVGRRALAQGAVSLAGRTTPDALAAIQCGFL